MSAGASAWGGGNTKKSACDKLQVVSQEILDTICQCPPPRKMSFWSTNKRCFDSQHCRDAWVLCQDMSILKHCQETLCQETLECSVTGRDAPHQLLVPLAHMISLLAQFVSYHPQTSSITCFWTHFVSCAKVIRLVPGSVGLKQLQCRAHCDIFKEVAPTYLKRQPRTQDALSQRHPYRRHSTPEMLAVDSSARTVDSTVLFEGLCRSF